MYYNFEQWKYEMLLKRMGLEAVEQRFTDQDIFQVCLAIKQEKQLADLRKAYEEKLAASVTANAAQ